MKKPACGSGSADGAAGICAMVWVVLIAFALAAAAPVRADDAKVVAPFRFTGPMKELTPMDRERALVYRNQLEQDLRDLEQSDQRGRLDPLGRRRLSETRGELNRVNKLLLLPPPAAGGAAPGSRTLPSLRSSPIPSR
jgi:hypothetical protein